MPESHARQGGVRPIITPPAKGYSVHLGGPWYFVANPDTGRLYYAKDYGPGTHEVDPRHVQPDVRARVEGRVR